MQQPTIETERLIIRELLPEDVEGMFEMDSDPEVHKYLGNQPIKTMEDAFADIEFVRKQYIDNGIGRWAMLEKQSGNFVGWTGLKLVTENINGKINYYDLGYRLARKFWGKGYATESAIASRDYGFNNLGINEMYAWADVDNSASIKVLGKTGLKFLGEFYHFGRQQKWFGIKKTETNSI